MDARRIEEASLNAWPALQQILFDGWVLRFSQGYTKRANSATPLYAGRLELATKVNLCQDLYARQGLPAIFRLTSFATPAGLDTMLERRGYRQIDRTLVMTMGLHDREMKAPHDAELIEEGLEAWLDTFSRFRDAPLAKRQAHKSILQAIPSRRLFASLRLGSQTVACGLGVLEAGCFGLFDLITAPVERRKGYGTQLVSGMMQWAKDHEATCTYLQVMANNQPARSLYGQLGFETLYEYWYRVPQG
ncbi:MAG: GNAT family N-acetyltransferase [Anaerolineae bacterium]